MFNKALYAMLFLGALLLLPTGYSIQKAYALPYAPGDVFTGVGDGKIEVYDQDGVLKQTLDTTSASTEQTGMCFDASGHLRATSFQTGTMTEFDDSGAIVTHPWGGPFSTHPESCAVRAGGTVLVGEVDGDNRLTEWSADGTTLIDFWNPAIEDRGIDWIDLLPDDCTVRYTSEGGEIRAFDICTESQLPAFSTGLVGPCYAHRTLPDGTAVVACTTDVKVLAADGSVTTTYTDADMGLPSGILFALNLDIDGTSFWTAEYFSGEVRKVAISDGSVLKSWDTTPFAALSGLAVFAEPGEPPIGGGPVGGTIIPIDMVSLVVAGIYSQPLLLSTVGALAAALLTAIRLRKKL